MIKKLFLASLIAGAATAAHIETKVVSVTPTVDTSIYASGDVIGGLMTFSNAVGYQSTTGIVTSATVSDKNSTASDLELWVFSSNPSASTFTDQAAFTIADADITKVISVISLGSTSRFDAANNGVKYLGSISCPVSTTSKTLYAVLVSRGTPTFATSSDVTVKLAIASD